MSVTPLLDKSRLRPLSTADASWLSTLHAEAFDPPWSAKSFSDLLTLPTTRGWALEETPSLILYQLSKEEAEILTFQVESAHQGQGLGHTLLHQSINEIWALGARTLHLEVAESRTAARALYAALGFEVVGRRKGYYKTPHGREDALVCRISRNFDPLP